MPPTKSRPRRFKETQVRQSEGSGDTITTEKVLKDALKVDWKDSSATQQFANKYEQWFKAEERDSFDGGDILHKLAESNWPEDKLAGFLVWIIAHHQPLLGKRSRKAGNEFPLYWAIKQNTRTGNAFIHTVLSANRDILSGVLSQLSSHKYNYLHTIFQLKLPFATQIARLSAVTPSIWQQRGEFGETPLHMVTWDMPPLFEELCRGKDKDENEETDDHSEATDDESATTEGLSGTNGNPVEAKVVKILGSLLTGHAPALSETAPKWFPFARFQTWSTELKPKEVSSRVDQPRSPDPGATGTDADTTSRSWVKEVSLEDIADLVLAITSDYYKFREASDKPAQKKDAPDELPQEKQAPDKLSQEELLKLCLKYGKESLWVKRKVNMEDAIGKTWDDEALRRTPYQERVNELSTAWDNLKDCISKVVHISPGKQDVALRRVIIEDPVANAIRTCCVHSFDREEITKCLYTPGKEKHIDFDLAGLPNRSISVSFLERLGVHLEFESVLKYVALPQPVDEKPEPGQDMKESSVVARKRAVSDLRAVFDWLKGKGVRTIIKAIVIDYGSNHSDDTIINAIKGFNVEEWDWKKVDLDTDVIAECSENIRKISLYSSGNNAVLKGWASDQGLADKKKFKKLEEVRLFIRLQGVGTEDRRRENIRTFRERVTAIKVPGSDKTVAVEAFNDDGEVSFAQGFKNNEDQMPTEIPWISAVREFSIYIRNAPKRLRPAPVKIAIIDDGVDATLEMFAGKIAVGKSFCPYSTSADLMNAYYVPSGQHGTMMADLICRICPSLQLYIARLDERQSRLDNTRQITIASATKAIDWAVDCGVDIISMSWTIETPKDNTNKKELEGLETAIKRAADADIVMFCATNDQGNISVDNCHPRGEDVIRIGAATALGDRCSWVPEHFDFLLPGQNIPFKGLHQHSSHDGAGTTDYESGSSFATALASGLGGLLIHCDRLLKASAGGGGGPRDVPRRDWFRRKGKMRQAFSNLTLGLVRSKFLRAHQLLTEKLTMSLAELEQQPHLYYGAEDGAGGAAALGISAPPRETAINGDEPGRWRPTAMPLAKTRWAEPSASNALRKTLDELKKDLY